MAALPDPQPVLKQTHQQMGAMTAFLAQARNPVPQACALAPGSPVGLGFPQPSFIG